MVNDIAHGIVIGLVAAATVVALSVIAGVFGAVSLRAKIYATNWLNKHGKGAKAFIILSGHPQAVTAAQEVVVQVLNEVEREQAVAQATESKGGIGLHDKATNTPPEDPGVPTQNQPGRGQE